MCHHNKHLIRYFEFLHGSKIICFPLNISEKLYWQHWIESYINCSAVVLTNQCQSYTAFLFDVRCSKWPRPFFCNCFLPVMVYLCCSRMIVYLRCCSNVVNSKVCKQTKTCEIMRNISKLTAEVKLSASRRTTFSLNFYSVEEETSKCLPISKH